MKRVFDSVNSSLQSVFDVHPRVILFSVLGIVLAIFSAPVYGQDETAAIIEVEITCYNEAGDLINTGLGTISIDDNGEGTLLFTEPELAVQCIDLSLTLLEGGSTGGETDTTEPEVVEESSDDNGDNKPSDTEGLQGLFSAATGDNSAEPEADEPVEEPETVEESSSLGSPMNAVNNFGLDCPDVDAATNNGTRITAFLPDGDYTATLFTLEFQTFDPLLAVGFGDGFTCFPESPAIAEYVVDFSQGDIGSQVFGHRYGGAVELSLNNNPDGVTPVEFIVGGQNDSVGTSGEFMLIIEGVRLTPERSSHLYAVTITESLAESDIPLAAIMMGVNDTLDPSLTAAAFDDDQLIPLRACEDAGGSCDSDVDQSLEAASVVRAAVRTVRADDQDAAIVAQPGEYLANGIQDVFFIAAQDRQEITAREEYIMVFYGGLS